MPELKILPREFYDRDPISVAKELLGKLLVSKCDNKGILSGRIIEVESYLASGDPAAHSSAGETSKTKSLFKGAGHAYIHRMHGWNLLDLVCSEGSVLVRALAPTQGKAIMKRLRNTQDENNLTDGPGKLCKALEISYNLDGIDITTSQSKIYVADSVTNPKSTIIETPRIGISQGKNAILRFVLSE